MANQLTSRSCRIAATALLALVVSSAAPPARAQELDRVRAVVNGQVVTDLDVRAAMLFRLVEPTAAGGEAGVLEKLVERELILGEVDRYAGREPEEALIATRLKAILARAGSADELQAAERRTGMTEERLRQFVRDGLRIESYIDQRFTAAAQPTEDEITRYFRDHRQEFSAAAGPPTLESVRSEVSARASAARRAALVAEWIDRLRQRADITLLSREAR